MWFGILRLVSFKCVLISLFYSLALDEATELEVLDKDSTSMIINWTQPEGHWDVLTLQCIGYEGDEKNASIEVEKS